MTFVTSKIELFGEGFLTPFTIISHEIMYFLDVLYQTVSASILLVTPGVTAFVLVSLLCMIVNVSLNVEGIFIQFETFPTVTASRCLSSSNISSSNSSNLFLLEHHFV